MNGSSHHVVGAALGSASAHALGLPPTQVVIITTVSCLSARLPDLVQRGGPKAPRHMHRRAAHSLLLWVLWSLGTFLAVSALRGPPVLWAGGLAVGYMSHLLADWPTGKGIPWFWPIPFHRDREGKIQIKRYRLPRMIQVRTPLREAVVVLAAGAGGVLLWL